MLFLLERLILSIFFLSERFNTEYVFQGWVIRRRRIIRRIVLITFFQIAPYNTILGT